MHSDGKLEGVTILLNLKHLGPTSLYSMASYAEMNLKVRGQVFADCHPVEKTLAGTRSLNYHLSHGCSCHFV